MQTQKRRHSEIDTNIVGERLTAEYSYEERDVVQYALAVGARGDDLQYLYEKYGPRVLPSFVVIPTYPVVHELNRRLRGDPLGVLHLSQKIELRSSLPPRGTLLTTGVVTGLYDQGTMATLVVETETYDVAQRPLASTRWTVAYMLDGGFGGPRAARSDSVRTPSRPPDFRREQRVSETQAWLYRLLGDANPIHVDAAVARAAGFSAPILHGLCTYGFVCRTVLEACNHDDPSRLDSLSADFRKPVYPGDTLVIEGWSEEQDVLLSVHTAERPKELVLRNVRATLRG